METRVRSRNKEITIGPQYPVVLIGERINPTGNKRLADSLRSGSLDVLCREAHQQVRAGADILDINVGGTDMNEVELLPEAVSAVMKEVDVPLCIDSSNPEAIASALAVSEGKAIVNSVNGQEKSLDAILPIVKEHDAAVIGLLMDEDGIPSDPERRVAIARKIFEKAESLGIPREDVIIDCLAMSLGSDSKEGIRSLKTIAGIKEEFDANMTLGASNISFGLPERGTINGVFLALCIANGLTCAIADVAQVRTMVLAADLVLGKDNFGLRFIQSYRENLKKKTASNS